MEKYDFSGWATVHDVKCSDGRIITKDAFKHNDGKKVPLVWNHQHDNIENVIGYGILEHHDEGMRVYGFFNDSEAGLLGKTMVAHGDLVSLSIYANRLRQRGPKSDRYVEHGEIQEVSLVLAGANPEAYIDSVMSHSDSGEPIESEVEAYIFSGKELDLYHADSEEEDAEEETVTHADDNKKEETTKTMAEEKTVADVLNELTEEQQDAVYYVVGTVLEDAGVTDDDDDEAEHSEGGNNMKENVFDQNNEVAQGGVLSHSDQMEIIKLAKQSNVGTFKRALQIYAEENDIIQHSDDNVGIFEDYGVLFPELELLKKGEPETLYKYDNGWVGPALAKIHKSPFSRIRTRHADARVAELKAKGYQKKGDEKTVMGQITMINRETTPQTIYIKDSLHRDDIIDITDFDIVAYQWKQMRRVLDETMVLAAMVGDGRELDDPDKISEEHIRPIWKDNEEYTIHYDVDIEAAKTALQGTDTGANFGENYIYAEAIITAALYSREKFKGTGTPDFYCTPHLVNVMLLARDLNGRRIYDSKADLAKALNCGSIIEVEHFEGLTRTTEEGDTKKLLGLFVNLNDYTFGSTRGGEITKFEDFDMDFNLKKFMLETRLSGSLYKLKSAIALEEPVTVVAG